MTSDHTDIHASGGPAAGRIFGINHLQMAVRDMDEAVHFYRDLLGLRVVRTRGKVRIDGELVPGDRPPVTKNYFFDLGNGELLTLIEIGGLDRPDPSVYADVLWPASGAAPTKPHKMDHLAFNVRTRDELVWFVEHLRANGVPTSEIIDVKFDVKRSPSPFVGSVYFYDPTGNPLEIATFDAASPKWRDHRPRNWLMDEDPVPSLLEASD